MRIISWNVNGIRSMTNKLKSGEKTGCPTNNGIKTLIQEQMPDILCFQEIKTQNQRDFEFLASDYKYILTNFAEKKGYSGCALLTNHKPEWVSYHFDMYTEEQIGIHFVKEGRMITARFKECIVVTVYVPNSQDELARLQDRFEWERIIRNYLQLLKEQNNVPIVLCGDLNIAPEEIDIHDPRGKKMTAGFSTEERAEFTKLLEVGFVDTFRYLHKEAKYTYWSNFHKSREKNKGWRIDLILITDKEKIGAADCLTDYFGSDHCPVLLELK
jgi:exodeoxyribonuclease-3